MHTLGLPERQRLVLRALERWRGPQSCRMAARSPATLRASAPCVVRSFGLSSASQFSPSGQGESFAGNLCRSQRVDS
jgi:hypothetical protein